MNNNYTKKIHEIKSRDEHIAYAQNFRNRSQYDACRRHKVGYYKASETMLKTFTLSPSDIGWKTVLNNANLRDYTDYYKSKVELLPDTPFTSVDAQKILEIKNVSNASLLLRKIERLGYLKMIGDKLELHSGRRKMLFQKV